MEEKEHRHGGAPGLEFARLDIPERPVLDFSVNLNPLGPPDIIKEHWMELMDGIAGYPTVRGEGVASYYEEKYGIAPGNFMSGNGSTELIYLVPRAMGIRKVLVVTPSYHDYTRASRIAGAEVLACELSPDSGSFSIERDRVIRLFKKAEAIWIGNPNNPTGSLFSKDLILDLSSAYPEKWIILDEAFMPFVDGKGEASFLTPDPRSNVIVIHSLTKFYAIAGVRIGGVVADSEVISHLREIREPWTVNGVAERIAPLLLRTGEYEKRTLSLVRRERERMQAAFAGMGTIVPYPSVANFILSRWRRTDDLDDLLRHLLSRGIHVRDCRNFPGLEKNWFRCAVRSPEENDHLIAALSSYESSQRQ